MQSYDIVVIGGGPCGIATVVEAKKGGLSRILLLENFFQMEISFF